ncbi:MULTISPECIES: hypothetical protein [Moorena]|nr:MULTISPECIES: hypothetical protein [Moorena]
MVSGQWSAVSRGLLAHAGRTVAWHRLEACDVAHKLITDDTCT